MVSMLQPCRRRTQLSKVLLLRPMQQVQRLLDGGAPQGEQVGHVVQLAAPLLGRAACPVVGGLQCHAGDALRASPGDAAEMPIASHLGECNGYSAGVEW